MTIQGLLPEDAEAARAIERAAGEQFRKIGMGDIADHEPTPVAALHEYAEAGRGWMAHIDGSEEPVGYLLVDVVDGNAHVEQVSVVPAHQGEGIGRALMERARQWAVATARPAITLTTFADVEWNRPLYEHLGYSVLTDAEIGPELALRREHEATLGLDPDVRVCMRRFL